MEFYLRGICWIKFSNFYTSLHFQQINVGTTEFSNFYNTFDTAEQKRNQIEQRSGLSNHFYLARVLDRSALFHKRTVFLH